MKDLDKEYGKKGLVIYAVNIAMADPLEQVKAFVTKSGTTVPVLYDKGQKISKLYGVKFTPHMVLIDAKGEIFSVTRHLPIDQLRSLFHEDDDE